jgi:EAL domain-containing protein (putative c-di-GMP-specific phosphodiesterase class I)
VLVSGEDELLLQSTEKLARAHRLSTMAPLRKPPKPEALAAALAQWAAPAVGRPSGERKSYDAADLRRALDAGELINYYQPKVTVASGALIGVEALVRWQHPVDGLVFPDQFIPVAEASGLIHDLTRQVFRAALAQARDWLLAGMPLRVAVNVSMEDLATLQLADFVIAETAASGVPAQLVQLEITESRLMSELTRVLDELIRLRLKRFRLSVDDFGSGHSSLVQLRDLPFDELKIDRSFTHNAAHDARVRAIFEGSLGIGKLLGMEVVAEGVEDSDDWGFLAATGCDIAQGYFIGRPMPGPQLQHWLQEWKARVWQDQLVARPEPRA